jgi:hypothetical protein
VPKDADLSEASVAPDQSKSGFGGANISDEINTLCAHISLLFDRWPNVKATEAMRKAGSGALSVSAVVGDYPASGAELLFRRMLD